MSAIVPRRVAGVSVALAGTGAVLGAGFTAAVMGIVGLVVRVAPLSVPLAPLPVVAGVGGALGALLTPLTAFSLLRQVALGKAILGTLLGMALGTSVGLAATGQLAIAAGAGVAGFLLTAILLRLTAGSATRKPKGEEEG